MMNLDDGAHSTQECKRTAEKYALSKTEVVAKEVVEQQDHASADNPECIDEVSADLSEKSASIQKYEDEWAQLYTREDPDLGELRRRAVLGNLRASRFRSVCWRRLLGILSSDTANWLSELKSNRQHYARQLKTLCINPWVMDKPEDNPLSQNSESTWNQFFCDKELRAMIKQDVVRTFPGVDFFRKESIQDAMTNILFLYARENPAMCYRQGMHEILAPLLFVLHCDHQALLHTKEQVQVSPVVVEVLDPSYLEEDAYALFSHIISGIASSYRINDITPTATGYFPANMNSPSPDGSSSNRPENEVVVQLNWIRDSLLAPHDPELHAHLQHLEIPLPLFGIRWLRLLFGREFPLQDLLVLWDAIFAEGNNFELVNYVVVAMLIAIRHQLLSSDYTACLTYLMRYPGAVDISHIVEHALYLKDPHKYCAPVVTSFPNLPVVTVGGRTDLNRAGPSQPRERRFQEVAKQEKVAQKKAEGQTSTLTGRFKRLSTKSGKWVSSRSTPGSPARGESEAGIIEGYTLDDPALLQAELQHARAVMELCRVKLAQYHTLLKKSPVNDHTSVKQVLDGIQELCSLLHRRGHAASACEVEPAYEAGESRFERQPPSPPVRSVLAGYRSIPTPSQLSLQYSTPVRSKEKAHDGSADAAPREVQLKLFRHEEGAAGEEVRGAPLQNPLQELNS